MAYRLDPASAPEPEVRRTAHEQLLSSRDQVQCALTLTTPPDEQEEAVHQARKALKKTRALLRLVRPSLGMEYAGLNQRLREIARALSPTRDAQVASKTLRRLAPEQVQLIDRLDAQLASASIPSDLPDRLLAAAEDVQALTIPLTHAQLGKAYRKSARRARVAAEDAFEDGQHDSEAMHTFRKRVKDLWYHSRLLEAYDPKPLKAQRARLRELGDTLGLLQDLAVLEQMLDFDPRVQPAIERERRQLMKQVRKTRRAALRTVMRPTRVAH